MLEGGKGEKVGMSGRGGGDEVGARWLLFLQRLSDLLCINCRGLVTCFV